MQQETPTEQLQNDNHWSQLRKNIVIDCGHLPINWQEEIISWGKQHSSPSESEIGTLKKGLDLAKQLQRLGKNVICNICFSDTTQYLSSPFKRTLIKDLISSGKIENHLPQSYQSLIDKQKNNIDIFFSLQTQNSNRFTKQLKKLKKDLKALSAPEKIYNKYKTLFLSDKSRDTFVLTTPFLLNKEKENQILGGDWWDEEYITPHPTDLIQCPLLPIKKLKVIKTHSKHSGTLCPGSYMGQLLSFDETYDHIAIYSRDDDPTIGEKILRGVIAIFSFLPQTKKKFVQIISSSDTSEVEHSLITEETAKSYSKLTYNDFFNLFQESNLNHLYESYL